MKHSFWIICCATLWLGLMPLPASAQEDDANEREQPVQEVFQTGLVYPLERGEVQLTYTSRFSQGNGRTLRHTALNLEYSITDRWLSELQSMEIL